MTTRGPSDVDRACWRHRASFSIEPSSASRARAFVTRHLLAHGLEALLDDIELVVSELATNAMVHARTSFSVTLRSGEGVVRLEVRDESPLRPALVATGPLDTGGRGVLIVQGLSREWGSTVTDSGGKCVWAIFEAPTAPG